MLKLMQTDASDPWFFGVDISNTSSLVKLANERDLPKEVDEAIKNLKKKPDHEYVLASAIGSGETWGSNKNADIFPEEPLLGLQEDDEPRVKERGKPLKRYQTFEEGNFFHHHKNKPALGHPIFGYVPKTIWNPKMRTVLLIIGVDAKKDPETADLIKAGEPFEVSMGTRLPWDECTICHKRARVRSEYCDCGTKHGFNSILPDGRRVARINTKEYFFDISRVIRRAFEGGLSMFKVASDLLGATPSIDLAEEYKLTDPFGKPIQSEKKCKIYDDLADVSSKSPEHLQAIVKKMSISEKQIPFEILESISKLDLESVWRGFIEAGIIPTPSEFAIIFLCKLGRVDLAKKFDGKVGVLSRGIHENEIDPSFFKHVQIGNLKIQVGDVVKAFDNEIMRGRSIATIDSRMHHTLTHETSSCSFEECEIGEILSTLYAILRMNIAKHLSVFEKTAGAGRFLLGSSAVIAPYIYSAHIQQKQMYGEPTNIIQNSIANNPGKLALVGGLAVAAPEATREILKRLWQTPKI